MKRIYKIEKDLGLDKEKLFASIQYSAKAKLVDVNPNIDISKLNIPLMAKAENLAQKDLYYLLDILVSTNLNLNDDYFDKEFVWLAKSSPIDKQVNIGHSDKEIVGHITSCSAIDESYKPIDEKTELEDLPDLYHLLTSSVIYKYWRDAEMQEKMDKIIADIADDKYMTSMETLYSDFGYILIDEKSGEKSFIDRNKTTAHMTKYLRAFGGSGQYEGKKIGRVLKDLVFSGKGLVKEAANPASIILSLAQNNNNLSTNNSTEGRLVYISASEQKNLNDNSKKVDTMTEQELAAKLALENELKTVKDSLATVTAEKAALAKTLDDNKKSLAESQSNVEKLATALTKLQEVQTTASRVEIVVDKLALAKSDAAELVSTLVKLDDESFAKYISTAVKTKTPTVPVVVKTETVAEKVEKALSEVKVVETPVKLGASSEASVASDLELQKSIAEYMKNSKTDLK